MRKDSTNFTKQYTTNKNSKKRVVKNENYYAYKKKSLIKKSVLTGSTLAVVGICWYTKEVPVKAEIVVKNNSIEWNTDKNNLKGITFQIFKNGQVISETNHLNFFDNDQVDNQAPNQVSEIKTYRGINTFKILWQEPLDNGDDNIYQIFAVNKHGRKIFKTEETTSTYCSGIDKYIIKFNNKEFETEKPEFILDINELKKGSYPIEIKVIDKAGNESDFKKFNFDFEVLEFNVNEDSKLVPTNSKYNGNDYNFYIVDPESIKEDKETSLHDKKMFLLNQDIFSVLSNGTKPVTNTPSYNIKNNKLNLTWSKNTKEYQHSFYVEAVNKVTLDKVYSNLLEISGSSKVFGYHYAFNTKKEYEVVSTDNYCESNTISLDIKDLNKDTKYYFHVATIDNNGVLSDTKTIAVDLNKKSSFSEIQNIAKKIVSKITGTTTQEYFKVVNAIANKFPIDKVEELEKKNIKVTVINENFKDYLKESYNIEASNDYCVKSGNNIYFNAQQSTNYLIDMISSILK